MNQTWLWAVCLLIGLLTFGMRLSFIILLGKIRLAPIVHSALRFVPIAVLTALITPALVLSYNQFILPWENARLIAGTIAIVVAWKTRNVLMTIGAGMGCLILIDILISRL